MRQNSILSQRSQILLIFPRFSIHITSWLSKSLNFWFWRKFKHIKSFKQLQFPNILFNDPNFVPNTSFFWFFWPGNHKSWFKYHLLKLCNSLHTRLWALDFFPVKLLILSYKKNHFAFVAIYSRLAIFQSRYAVVWNARFYHQDYLDFVFD